MRQAFSFTIESNEDRYKAEESELYLDCVKERCNERKSLKRDLTEQTFSVSEPIIDVASLG